MKMTMYYVHGMWKKVDFHNNIPAVNPRDVFDFFHANMAKEAIVTEIIPLFEFDYEPESKIVGVN